MSEEKTRARAIEYLEHYKKVKYGMMPEWVWNMAIEALDQQSVIEDIKAEIETEYGSYDICEYYEDYDYEENDISEYQYVGTVADIINIIDKHCGKEEE